MIKPGTTIQFPIPVLKAGEPTNADAAVTCVLWRNGAATAVSVPASLSSQTGKYIGSFDIPANWNKADELWVVATCLILTRPAMAIVWTSADRIDDPMRGTDGANTVTPPSIAGLATDASVQVVNSSLGTVNANIGLVSGQVTNVSNRIPDALEGGRIKAVATVSTAGLATEATQLAILAQTSLIGTGTVAVNAPVTETGQLNDLVVGDAYQLAAGRAITFTLTNVAAGLQTILQNGATVHLGFLAFGKSRQSPGFVRYEFPGTIVSVGASTVVRVELTTLQTKGITPGRYDYDIEFRQGGNYVTSISNVEGEPMTWRESSTTLPA